MAFSDLDHKKQWLNAREWRKQKLPGLNVDAWCLTSEEGLRAAEAADAARQVKEQKKRDVEAHRAAKKAEITVQCAARPPDAPFSGSLPSKNLSELEDIALALSISLPQKKLTKSDFLAAIKAHFNSNPNLHQTPRFIGLFHRTCGQNRLNDENILLMEGPPMTQQCLNDHLPAQSQYSTQISPLPTGSLNTHGTFYDHDAHDSRLMTTSS
jgi:hypothetical protein